MKRDTPATPVLVGEPVTADPPDGVGSGPTTVPERHPGTGENRHPATGNGHDGRKPHDRRDDHVHRITSAQLSLTEDVRRRQRKYLLSNGLRVVCFILAIVLHHSGPLFFALIIGSLVLPYVAVIIANAGRERDAAPPTTYALSGHRELTAGPPDEDVEAADRGGDIEGEAQEVPNPADVVVPAHDPATQGED